MEEVELGSVSDAEKSLAALPQGRWFLPYSLKIKMLMEFSYRTGMMRYNLSGKRKAAARKTARTSPDVFLS